MIFEAEGIKRDRPRCLVCSKSLPDSLCSTCKSRIQAERSIIKTRIEKGFAVAVVIAIPMEGVVLQEPAGMKQAMFQQAKKRRRSVRPGAAILHIVPGNGHCAVRENKDRCPLLLVMIR